MPPVKGCICCIAFKSHHSTTKSKSKQVAERFSSSLFSLQLSHPQLHHPVVALLHFSPPNLKVEVPAQAQHHSDLKVDQRHPMPNLLEQQYMHSQGFAHPASDLKVEVSRWCRMRLSLRSWSTLRWCSRFSTTAPT